jgi:hypothetical protein
MIFVFVFFVLFFLISKHDFCCCLIWLKMHKCIVEVFQISRSCMNLLYQRKTVCCLGEDKSVICILYIDKDVNCGGVGS